MSKAKRRWAFAAVSTALQIGHGLVALAAVGFGVLVLVQFSRMGKDLGVWSHPLLIAVIAALCLHVALMLATPLWNWLAARQQRRVSRLWAWLGYFIPLASYWLPWHSLHQLADGAGSDAARRRRLILGWGITRGLAAPTAAFAVLGLMVHFNLTAVVWGGVFLTYMTVAIAVANLLSLFTIGQMRQYLATTAVDERHAEVFA